MRKWSGKRRLKSYRTIMAYSASNSASLCDQIPKVMGAPAVEQRSIKYGRCKLIFNTLRISKAKSLGPKRWGARKVVVIFRTLWGAQETALTFLVQNYQRVEWITQAPSNKQGSFHIQSFPFARINFELVHSNMSVVL